jgi:hypothetical protein
VSRPEDPAPGSLRLVQSVAAAHHHGASWPSFAFAAQFMGASFSDDLSERLLKRIADSYAQAKRPLDRWPRRQILYVRAVAQHPREDSEDWRLITQDKGAARLTVSLFGACYGERVKLVFHVRLHDWGKERFHPKRTEG